jgi:hypothetical protein
VLGFEVRYGFLRPSLSFALTARRQFVNSRVSIDIWFHRALPRHPFFHHEVVMPDHWVPTPGKVLVCHLQFDPRLEKK